LSVEGIPFYEWEFQAISCEALEKNAEPLKVIIYYSPSLAVRKCDVKCDVQRGGQDFEGFNLKNYKNKT
jgi:hypothetical protein